MKRKPSQPVFQETISATTSPGRKQLLNQRISDLSLQIPGSRLESLITKLYKELEEKGISFKPKCYLADEWGCPDLSPVIGIPFYLADHQLGELETQLTGVAAENDEETLLYLRHEAGHTVNYAYKLYARADWRKIFGPFSCPYKDLYFPKPFSPNYVRHIPGWYSQKHPDDDFAETFAVWLTPNSDWQKKYADTPALTKLEYVDRVVKTISHCAPLAVKEILENNVQELTETLAQWYEPENRKTINLPTIINEDLKLLFPYASGNSAALFLNANRKRFSQIVNAWTGIDQEIIESLLEDLVKRTACLNLKAGSGQTEEIFSAVTTFLTVLIMNYLYTKKFV